MVIGILLIQTPNFVVFLPHPFHPTGLCLFRSQIMPSLPPFSLYRASAAVSAVAMLPAISSSLSRVSKMPLTSSMSMFSQIPNSPDPPNNQQRPQNHVDLLAKRISGLPICTSLSPISSALEKPDESVPETEEWSQSLVVVSFYKFAAFSDYESLRKPLKNLCEELRVSGGIILAPEGINGSICGTRESVENVLGFIQSDKRLSGLRQIESPVGPEEEAIHHGHTSKSPLGAGDDAPFRWDHVRVKLKKEIVTFGNPKVSPIEQVGTYVKPKEWNSLISDPNTMVIDVRNDYETRIGTFKGAVDPCTTSFREFSSWVDKKFQLAEHEQDNATGENSESQEVKLPSRVAMYCTGGIRCEKATSFLLSKGFKEVYHLEGGILKYLEEIPETESLWEGECFVFDKRVAVEHGLKQGTYKLCYGCKKPISDADMESPEWEEGVSCPYCFSEKSPEELARARARQRQYETWGIIGGPDRGVRKHVPVNLSESPRSI
ncbi:Rhodanese-like domain-containing protein 7 [Nymphaea thermarum]|nr:Rhodanese-like domain-containing protein 7 [Nymphaea thermarum]